MAKLGRGLITRYKALPLGGTARVPKLRFDRETLRWAGQSVLPTLDSILMHFNGIEEHEIFPNEMFAWTPPLEANWVKIRDEAQEVLRDSMSVPSVRALSSDHHKIAVDDKWRSFFLWAYGLRIDADCARCPETTRVVECIPDLLSAFYSIMLAGAHVPRHTGPTKAIITAHLGLIMPTRRENCRMELGDRQVIWEEGRVVVFDDMHPHEVWNDTNEDRVILLLHLKRPLRFPGSALRDLFFGALRSSPFVQDALRNLERWEKSKVEHRASA